jgi:hypothetical protein
VSSTFPPSTTASSPVSSPPVVTTFEDPPASSPPFRGPAEDRAIARVARRVVVLVVLGASLATRAALDAARVTVTVAITHNPIPQRYQRHRNQPDARRRRRPSITEHPSRRGNTRLQWMDLMLNQTLS